MPLLPLIEGLAQGPISPGASILVEFDPSSLWYNATFTIAAGWLKSGGRVSYHAQTRPPHEIRAKLGQLGLDVDKLEKEDRLRIWDFYTLTLGKKSREKYAPPSLKVPDLSIWFAKAQLRTSPDAIVIGENNSIVGRINDEKSWVEFWLNRYIPNARTSQVRHVGGLMLGVHSEWAYKQFESAADGIVDFKVEELSGELRSLMRIRVMRDVAFDSRWHPLKIGENFEIKLEK